MFTHMLIYLIPIGVVGFDHQAETTHGKQDDMPCLSRMECNGAEVCVGSEWQLAKGFCSSCESLNGTRCYPPCYVSGNECLTDQYSLAMKLDEQPPFYLVCVGAVTKPCVQLMVFPLKKKGDFSGILGRGKQATQLFFLGMAINNFIHDVMKLWDVAWNNKLTIWQTMLALSVVLSMTPNITALCNAMFQSLLVADKTEGNRTVDDIPPKSLGNIFTFYFIFLFFTYFPLTMLLLCVSLPAAVGYIWITLPVFAGAALIGVVAYSLVVYMVRCRSSDAQAALAERLLDAAKVDPDRVFFGLSFNISEGDNQFLAFYFVYAFLTPFLQFIIITQARWLDGYGYIWAVYMTLSERHVRAYADVAERSVSQKLLLAWIFV